MSNSPLAIRLAQGLCEKPFAVASLAPLALSAVAASASSAL